jgi:hypothetical protein
MPANKEFISNLSRPDNLECRPAISLLLFSMANAMFYQSIWRYDYTLHDYRVTCKVQRVN